MRNLLIISLIFLSGIAHAGMVYNPLSDEMDNTGDGTVSSLEWDNDGSYIFTDDTFSRVGINTSKPEFALDVIGVINANSDLRVNNVSVCLSDNTNCYPVAPGGWTDAGATVYATSTGDNVGIGTINPLTKLHVKGEITVDGATSGALLANNMKIDGDDTNKMTFSQTAGTNNEDIRFDLETTANTWAIDSSTGVVTMSAPAISFVTGGLRSGGSLNVGASYDTEQTAPTNGALIQGNVGIGTFAVSNALQVIGTVNATAFVGDGSGLTGISGGSGGWVDGGTNIYASPTTDNVAIGTTTPTQKLTVVGTVSATAFTGDGSALTGIATGGWTDGGTNVYTETTTDNVGIGTTTPTATLLVSNVGTGNSFRVNDAAADTTPFVITSNGNVGIGTLNPGSALHNNGTMWIGNGSTGGTLIMTANNGMTYTYNFAYDASARTMHNFVTSGHGGTSGVRTTGVKSSTSSYQTDTGSSVVALHGEATSVNTSGTMDNSYGVLGSTVRNGSGGTVTNAWSIYGAGNTATAGTTTRVYAGGFEGRVGIGGNIGIGSTITGSYVTTTPPTGGMIVEGNVGIGSLTPGQKLDVQGTVRATAFSGDGSALTGISGGSIGIGTANTITFWPTTTTIGSLPTATYPSLTELSYVKGATSNIQTQINGISGGWVDGGTNIYASPTTDNVAIGTTTPTQKLTVVGTVSATAFVGDGSGITGLSAGAWTDGGTNIYPATTSDQVAIGTTTPVAGSILTVNGIIAGGGSGDVRFTGSNVGIGTSTAKSTLLYVSTTGGTVDSASTGDVYIQNDLEVDGTVYMASCSGAGCGTAGGGWVDGGTNIYASPTTDNVGIGTTTPTSGFKLDVRGDSYFLGNIGIGTTVTNARLDLSKNTDTELVLKDTPGENFYNSAQWDGKNYRIYHGSTANPVTTAGPTFKISRGESVASATCGSNPVDSECNAALSVVSAGAATSGMQTAAIAATALTAHAQDAVALWAIGSEVSGGSGKGTGAYLEGGRNDSSGTAVGAEIRISNDASADDTYETTQISDTSGLWITTNSTGGYDSAEGLGFGAIGSSQFVTGIGFKEGSVKTDSIRDNSSSHTAINIQGTHTNALIATSGNVGIGTSTAGEKLIVSGSSTGNIAAYLDNKNSAGITSVRVANSADNGFRMVATGSGYAVPNAYGMLVTTGEKLIFGEEDGTMNVTINGSGNVGIGSSSPNAALDIRVSTSSIGWTVQTASNQACNTTCTAGCVFGQDTGTSNGPIVNCSDASADRCLCAGSN